MFLSSGLKQMRGQDRSVNLGSFVITLFTSPITRSS